MKKIITLAAGLVFTTTLLAQTTEKINRANAGANSTICQPISRFSDPSIEQKAKGEGQLKALCTDKVTFVNHGSFSGDWIKIGGDDGWDNASQAFPGYTGTVTRIDIHGNSFAGSIPVQASIYALGAGNVPTGSPLGSANIMLTSSWTEHGVNLATPVNVTNGFVVVIWDLEAGDSARIALNDEGSGLGNNFSHLYASSAGTYSLLNYYGYDVDCMFRPTIQFDTRPVTLTATPTTACAGIPVNFNYTTGSAPHYNNPIYNPAGVLLSLNYGDGSANGTSLPVAHTYTTAGVMNASLTETYIGYATNCTSTPATQTITVNPGTESWFSWSSTNLAVQFNDLCTNTSTYSWVFGDGGTSGAPSPVHNYPASGTYTVELTANGPCGSDYYTTNIMISDSTNNGNLGVTEVSEPFHLGIYPNPTNGIFTIAIETANTNPMVIEVLSPIGQVIFSQNVNAASEISLPIDLTNYANGMYFVHITQGDLDITKQIVNQ